MKISVSGAAADAWAMWRRDHDVLIAVALLFLFLPTLALLLLVPSPPDSSGIGTSEAEAAKFIDLYSTWAVANARWFLIAAIMGLQGGLTIIAFYLDPTSGDVKAVLGRAFSLLPRYALAYLIVLVPASIGVLALLVPSFWLLGRMLLVGPVLVAERPISAIGSLRRSWAHTRGNDLVLTALMALVLICQQFLPSPFLAIDEAMQAAHSVNPVFLAIVDSVAAAVAAATALALVLLRVAVYRQVAANSGI